MAKCVLGDPGAVITSSIKDIIDSAKVAGKTGARVIGTLGSQNASLLRFCDIAFSVHSQEAALRLAPMTSRLVQLAIVDVLFVIRWPCRISM